MSRAVVQYHFSEDEHPISVRPHGNSKKGTGFIRTMPSTLDILDTVAEKQTPKGAVHSVSSQLGGIINSQSAGTLPRNRQQVKDRRRKGMNTTANNDPLLAAMFMCKETMPGFVRKVMGAPDYMVVICDDRTLNNLVRFCANPHSPQILSVDPTFSLGKFDVTVTTYKHPLVATSSTSNPTMLGPVLIHQRKKFQNYQFFASSLLGMRPSLKDLHAFGTDGETALVDAFCSVFPNALHLRCFLHFKDNMKNKLEHQMHFPQDISKDFIADVLGSVFGREKGLVDAEDEAMFDVQLHTMKEHWDHKEQALTNSTPTFHGWFVKNCAETIRTAMLAPIRIAAGLGSPPSPYYTNSVESMNSLLKREMGNKKLDLCQFIEQLQRVVDAQYSEVDRALAGLGEYSVCENLSEFHFTASEWCHMNTEQRKRTLSRFVNYTPKQQEIPITSENSDEEANPLSVLQIPGYVASTIWRQQKSLQGHNNITAAPGSSTTCAWMVASLSGSRPHYVKLERGRYMCDKDCTFFQSTKICAHIIAIVNMEGKLEEFLSTHTKQCSIVNATTLAESGLPHSAIGKKPSKRKGMSKKTSAKATTARTLRKTLTTALRHNDSEVSYVQVQPSTPHLSSQPGTLQVSPSQPGTLQVSPSQPGTSQVTQSQPGPLQVPLSQPGPSQPGTSQVPPSQPGPLQVPPSQPRPSLVLLSQPGPLLDAPSQPGPSQVPPSQTGPSQILSLPGPLISPSQSRSPQPSQPLSPLAQLQPDHATPWSTHPAWQAASPQLQVPLQDQSMSWPTYSMTPCVRHQCMPSVTVGCAPFNLVFIKGNIAICSGCRQRFLKKVNGAVADPPDDIVIQHMEERSFKSPTTGLPTSKRGNAYYHVNLPCLRTNWPHFVGQHINIDPMVKSQLRMEHKTMLLNCLGIHI